MSGGNLSSVKSDSLESLDLKPLPSKKPSLLRKHCCKSKKLVSLEDDSGSQSDSGSGRIAVEWTWDRKKRQNAAHVPLPATITVAIPVGWSWDRNKRQSAARCPCSRNHYSCRNSWMDMGPQQD
ncbi:hypothetical protein AVEN_13144-1 [Araneus ventricosus]|uniref:Uncharacterized protein n=1 Tax=Araneus ventricosus TaxID=182803 RepID=A0A4Y2KXE8_ARAVE|nr:hypothetical protein AVEN_13144-1 [Araneus ventricosus]